MLTHIDIFYRKIEDLLKDTAKITEDGEDKPVSEVPGKNKNLK